MSFKVASFKKSQEGECQGLKKWFHLCILDLCKVSKVAQIDFLDQSYQVKFKQEMFYSHWTRAVHPGQQKANIITLTVST